MILIPLLLIFASYIAFSLLLFFFPTILHKKHKHKVKSLQEAVDGVRILRIAHRGGARHITQNTIEAFKKALPHSDMLEMDVCETKDGVLVAHHDHELLRTCGVQGFVRDFKFEELPPFKEEIELNFAGQGHKVRSNKQKIPTLQEVFKTFPTVPMNIELKAPTKFSLKELRRLLNEYNRKNITIVGIRGEMQQQLRQGDLNGLRFMNDKSFFQTLFLLITGLLPFVYIQQASLQVPLHTEEFYKWKIRQWGNNWKTHLYFRGIKIMNLLIWPLISHLRKRGIMTIYWVCNYEEDFKRAINYGACGIMTDDPPLLDQYLQKVHQKEEQFSQLQSEKKTQ